MFIYVYMQRSYILDKSQIAACKTSKERLLRKLLEKVS